MNDSLLLGALAALAVAFAGGLLARGRLRVVIAGVGVAVLTVLAVLAAIPR